jgi:tetratricopeptide (TPR) repeat protein
MNPHAGLRAAAGLALLLACAGCSTFFGARLYGSGSRALDRGDVSAAISDLEQAARLLPESSEVQNHLGIAYEAAGREDAALAAWRRAVALDCGNEAALGNLRSAEARLEPALAPSAGAASR